MKKILITDAVDKKCADILTKAGHSVTYQPGMPREEIKKVIGEYNALIVRSETKANAELISLMENMEVIGRAGTGTDNIDTTAATRKGIIVMNTPGGNTISTAEHTMSLMLSMCRNIPQSNHSIRSGKWDKKSYKGTELQNKTLGVIGLGKIGREVAIRSKAFEMKVIGYDPVLSPDVANNLGIKLVDLNTLFKESDLITVHVPLTPETKEMINDNTLALCKKGVKIINCARGGIIDEAAIIRGLESGQVSGAAFDVYMVEPPDFSNPLFNHPKVVCTPHLGASTDEAQEKVAIQIAEQVVDLFEGKTVKGSINASAVNALTNKELTPYIQLAEILGKFQAQLINGQLKTINIKTVGDFLQDKSEYISAAVLKGFLSTMITDAVNLVNSPFLAEEMGIHITETKLSGKSNYNNLLTVEFKTENNSRAISGTVFGENEIRIVFIDEYHVELKPEGNMLLYSNIDKPGMLAMVGNILSNSNINIAGLSLGRLGIGKEALTVVSVDSPLTPEVVKEIEAINGVKNVYTVKI